MGFAAEAVFLGGGERGRFAPKKGVTLLPRATDFQEKKSPQAQARSVARLFWYWFEVLFCGGSQNSTSKGSLQQKQNICLSYYFL
jgi:hypothetical protein